MRTARVRTPFQALRAAAVALTILTLVAGAHVLAGGQLPAPGILLAFLALTGLVSTAATRLKLTLPALAGLLGTGQVVLHEAFSAFSTHGNLTGTVDGGAAASSHHPGVAGIPVPTAHVQLHELDSALAVSMSIGHALATLTCALLLAKAEDALWSLAAWLRPLVQLPAPVTPPTVPVPVPPSPSDEGLPLPWRNLRRDCRRGPPAVVVPS